MTCRRAARAVRDGALPDRTRRSVAGDRRAARTRCSSLVATPAVQFDWLVTQPYGSVDLARLRRAHRRGGRPASVRERHRVRPPGARLLGQHRRRPDARDRHGHRRIQAGSAARRSSPRERRWPLWPPDTARLRTPSPLWRRRDSGSTAGGSCSKGLPGVTAQPVARSSASRSATAAAIAWLWRTDALPPWRAAGRDLRDGGRHLARRRHVAVGRDEPLCVPLHVSDADDRRRRRLDVVAALFAKRTKALTVAALAALAAVVDRSLRHAVARPQSNADSTIASAGRPPPCCTAAPRSIGGDYWRVWPAVFHANLTLVRTHAHARVFGLAYRSEETDPLWQSAGQSVLIAGCARRSIGRGRGRRARHRRPRC